MTKYKDINGTTIEVGDLVYYARKASYRANGLLVKGFVVKENSNSLAIFTEEGTCQSTSPSNQIVKGSLSVKVIKRTESTYMYEIHRDGYMFVQAGNFISKESCLKAGIKLAIKLS